ncbi:hypothetical protein NDU88_000403 [Pleurodeles waltl]|uniref:C-type lectin domain-containing protein n=1 Tax=Pleurodeles waltl TaxID=8319 RepID=A0AAV7P4W2_PLEWA|nr:hypothetical protein NDU88_000403 [Pleurodeles waltl]
MSGGRGTHSMSCQADPEVYHHVPAGHGPEKKPRTPWWRRWLLYLQLWFKFLCQDHHKISSPVQPRCPDYSVYFKERCYYLNETREEWHASNYSCFLNNGFLAVFETPKDLEFLLATFSHAVPWIGLHKKGDMYLWVDGQAFNESTFQLVIREDCAYIDIGSITTTSCDLPKAFICMKM